MNEAAFQEKLKQGGYAEGVIKEMDANYHEDTHTHDFGASIMVLSGKISVTLEDGSVETCQTVDTFALEANIPHAEQVGPEGVRFLVGRK
jgi:quercetin dioxygenase-like cupin family protein